MARQKEQHLNIPDDYTSTQDYSVHASRARSFIPNGTAVAYSAVDLLRNAATDPQVYRRLVTLLGILGVLLVLGCMLGVAWRIDWPQLPELPVPVIMF
jgi:hypothetical protein